MTTPVTRPEIRDLAHAAFGNRSVTMIKDSAGFISQRIIAMIVNIACDIAQQRIATPTDIDLAVRLGLNYPNGPLSIGDALGSARILEILLNMQRCYGDPRYRPSPWLYRRARLGVSLLTEET
jgi:3-hydroxybutyryl-CoA dehydrogenase